MIAMTYTSARFLILFLPVLFLFYWALRKHHAVQNAVLLIGSMVFYMSFGKRYVLVLAGCILLTYYGGKIISKNRKMIWLFFPANLFILLFFKYGIRLLPESGLIMPIGLSFYILQSSSYLFDIYNEKIVPENSLVDYSLFVSFFPCIVSGPIQKSRLFLPEIKKDKSLSYETAASAVFLFLYGVFLKMVIADRLALFTGPVFSGYSAYEGGIILFAAILYSFEIYCDFYGYTCMVSAVALLFGYRLADNFRQPYFAVSITDFWKRWHMSLTSWLTEYVYIPLGGNRKGTVRKYWNILIVFVVSALWHGTGNHFLVWGLLHGLYRIIGELSLPYREKLCSTLSIDRNKKGYRFLQRIFTFLIVTAAWVYFRADSVRAATGMIQQIFTDFHAHVFFDGTLFSYAIDPGHFFVLLLSLEAVLIVSWLREKGLRVVSLTREILVVRWGILILLFFVILIAGVYGPAYDAGNFIYAAF